MARLAVLVCAILLIGTAGAEAAELVKAGNGCTVNGQPAGSTPVMLAPGNSVKGPGTVKTASGKLLLLGAESTIVVDPAEGGVEVFSVTGGWVQGEVDDKTNLALSVGKLLVPEAGACEFYVENLGPSRSLYRINKGNATVLFGQFRAEVGAGNALELKGTPTAKDLIDFSTLPGNRGDVMIVADISATLNVDVVVPRATMGRVEPWDKNTKTRISSDPGSWQRGSIQIQTHPVGRAEQTGVLGPGTFAIVDNLTGEFVEFGFKEIAPAVIERAISLTSEFALLAVSNFFGLDD